MPRWVWPAALLIVIGGALAGYLSVPHYRPPNSADEARLRERAAEFYRASRLFDMAAMVRLYTPARQLGDTAQLDGLVRQRRADIARMKPETRWQHEQAAAGVNPDKLELRIEGDWAVTSGTAALPASADHAGSEVPLESIVWLKTDGDWWIYLLHPSELVCYGNPPDFARVYVADQRQERELQQMLDAAQEEAEGAGDAG